MTPTLYGRFQSRFVLFLLVALPISLIFSIVLSERHFLSASLPYVIVSWMFLVGLVLDFLYIQIQRYRWDQDWPFVFQLFSTCFEFGLVVFLGWHGWLPFLEAPDLASNITTAIGQFAITLVVSFVGLLGFIQVFDLNWRFNGGQFGHF